MESEISITLNVDLTSIMTLFYIIVLLHFNIM